MLGLERGMPKDNGLLLPKNTLIVLRNDDTEIKRNNPVGNKEQVLACTPAAVKGRGAHGLRASQKCNLVCMVALPSAPLVRLVFCCRLPGSFTEKT